MSFVKGTSILRADGSTELIEKVKQGMSLRTSLGVMDIFNGVMEVYPDPTPIITITPSSGPVIRCSRSQLLWTQSLEGTEISRKIASAVNPFFVSLLDQHQQRVMIASISHSELYTGQLFDIEFRVSDASYVANGILARGQGGIPGFNG